MPITTCAARCRAQGDGLSVATVRQQASFTVNACDAEGEPVQQGGNIFFIAIRGASRVRAKVTDNQDGTYSVAYKPSVSGHYSVSISLFGEPVAGSPFQVETFAPKPDASKCELRGECLTHAIARASHTFEVRFRDTLGQVAHAEELDVYAVPIENDVTSGSSAIDSSSAAPAPALAPLTPANPQSLLPARAPHVFGSSRHGPGAGKQGLAIVAAASACRSRTSSVSIRSSTRKSRSERQKKNFMTRTDGTGAHWH